MKWTKALNMDIIRCYYKAIIKAPASYRQAMANEWMYLHPDVVISEQRLADQKRIIFKKLQGNRRNLRGEWLSEWEIKDIEETIQKEYGYTATHESNSDETEIDAEVDIPENHTNVDMTSPIQVLPDNPQETLTQAEQRLFDRLSDNFDAYLLVDIDKRPRIVKPSNKELKFIQTQCTLINKVIPPLVQRVNHLSDLNCLLFAALITALEMVGSKSIFHTGRPRSNITTKVDYKPKWQIRLESQIHFIRMDISKITQMNGVIRSPKITRNSNNMRKKYNIKNEQRRLEVLENLKQKLKAFAGRISRYKKQRRKRKDNADFQNNPKRFYRQLEGDAQANPSNFPDLWQQEAYWNNLYATGNHNSEAAWISEYRATLKNVHRQELQVVTKQDIKNSVTSLSNWKACGIDQIHNFWLKQFPATHQRLSECLTDILNQPETAPLWLTRGITTLIPKKEEASSPDHFRPITCLNTMYKLFTSVLSKSIREHLLLQNLFPDEQKGCSVKSLGCKDLLLLDMYLTDDYLQRQRSFSTCWIDYAKAFDSVPHSWIIEAMKLHKLSDKLVRFQSVSMKNWKTTLTYGGNNTRRSKEVKLERGIFQGDSLSPLLFCMCLFPLSWMLNKTGLGLEIKDKDTGRVHRKLNHLLFIDDLKLMGGNDNQLKQLVDTTKRFSDDISMKFGLNKCAKAKVVKGKVIQTEGMNLDGDQCIEPLHSPTSYRYLGLDENPRIQHQKMKEKFRNAYLSRLKKVLGTQLSSKNKIQAINAWAVPCLSYGFGIINWSVTDLQEIDRKTRKLFTVNHMLHPRSAIERLYLPRQHGGRGLINIELQFKKAIISVAAKLQSVDTDTNKLILKLDPGRGPHSLLQLSESYRREFKLPVNGTQHSDQNKLKKALQTASVKYLETRLDDKAMHSQFQKLLDEPFINKNKSLMWMMDKRVTSETEGHILAIQDQAITTNYIRRQIFKQDVSGKCRMCNEADETIHHIISSCPALAPTSYLQRHNNVARYVHHALCKAYKISVCSEWFKHIPNAVEETTRVKILWDFHIQTDNRLQHNQPDLVVIDKQQKSGQVIDIAVPLDANVAKKRSEKMLKYKDLVIELQRIWHIPTWDIIPVILGATGVIHNKLIEDISKLQCQISLRELQKTAILGTCRIVRRVLS